MSKSIGAEPSATLKVRVAPCNVRLPAILAWAAAGVQVTPPFKPRLPAPVITFPPVSDNEPTLPVKPFRSKSPELLIVTATELANCPFAVNRTTSALAPSSPSPIASGPAIAIPALPNSRVPWLTTVSPV